MAEAQDFLFELGTEELPPGSLLALSKAFTTSVEKQLLEKQLSFSSIDAFATPRRLALRVNTLSVQTPKQESPLWGPPAKIAFNAEGKPTKAAEAFAKKNDLTLDELQTASDGKVEKLFVMKVSGGEKVEMLLPNIINQALDSLPIAKRMRWGSSREEFVRPAQWCLALWGSNVLDMEVFALRSDRSTRGHRFHCDDAINIPAPQQYETILEKQGKVIASFAARKALITKQVKDIAKELTASAVIDEDLLEEVSALVEWPVALAGNFDKDFLRIPAQALISSMKEHQKYFHLLDGDQKLLPYFITVANIESVEPEKIVDGNERVIRPRLADAAFFFDTDKQNSLESRLEKLDSVVFQTELGTVLDKTQRLQSICAFLSHNLGLDPTVAQTAQRAAKLSKSDLVTLMVYEFPEMQGIAGYHYALNDGEDETVASAILQHYQPKFSGDHLPDSPAGNLLALADRVDTITGIFGIGMKPSGSKDPFALRRASLAALRILVENKMDIDLRALIEFCAQQFAALTNKAVVEEVLTYMIERFRAWYDEAGIAPQIYQAVQAKGLSHPLDIDARVQAVASFVKMPQAQSLAAANKRVANLLSKSASDSALGSINTSALEEDAEIALAEHLILLDKKIDHTVSYEDTLTQLAKLQEPVDKFFDDVMVMCDDQALRKNRLALLHKLRNMFLGVADISYLAIK